MKRGITVEEFLNTRSDLPDSGQWSELIRGVPVSLSPPDIEHGNAVLNLSKAFSEYVHRTLRGYACFDLGVQVEASPDTVFFPAACYFIAGERFAETDREVAEQTPDLVIEFLSTNDRRKTLNDRVTAYQNKGVDTLWLIDPNQETVHVVSPENPNPQRFEHPQHLVGGGVLPDFSIPVSQLFAPPRWDK